MRFEFFSLQSSTDVDRTDGDRVSLNSEAPLCTTRRQVTWRDIQMILPTAFILLITIIVMLTVIPYAFSTVFRQMEAVRALEEASKNINFNVF